MELSSSNTRKFLIFSLKKAFLIIPEMELFYISRSGNYEKIPYIFLKESCSYILGNGDPEKIP